MTYFGAVNAVAVAKASNIIAEVIEGRKKKLGKENPYTLLAMTNAALVKNALGHTEEADELIQPIAERNLGEKHIGTLFGYMTLASVRIRQERYAEAEEILLNVTEEQKTMASNRGDYHPDRLDAMIELAKCYRLQGRIAESVRIRDEALEGFEAISKKEHPLARNMRTAGNRMVEHLEAVEMGRMGDPDIAAVAPAVYRQCSIFGELDLRPVPVARVESLYGIQIMS